MDEEELQKRFTDCVYFLASPLTCKKGIECEYRHSEIARLNPRDCWYWLGGCCFNPDCAFRHPPLEGLKEAYYEPSNLNNPPALPMEKTNIPCYFYSKGFCNKGEKCSFLHGPADVIHALKPSKPPSMVNNPIPSDKKSSEESKTGSPPLKPHPNPSENAQMDHTITMRKPTQDSHQEETTQDSEQEESTEDSDSGSDSGSDSDSEQEERSEESPDLSNSLDLQEEFVQSESDVFNDQSSGFDVVVEGEPERLDYEQDVDFFDHEEDPIEYDPTPPYPIELGNGFVKERYDVYDRLDKGQSRTSIFYRLSFKKQNLHSQPVFNGRKGHHDLREHLKRRKVVVDGGFKYDFSQGHNRNFRRQPQRKVVPVNRASRRPHAMQQKRRFCKGKSGVFTGPKSLGEIKEEKKNGFQGKDGFQGPRPLSEILKNKRKLG